VEARAQEQELALYREQLLPGAVKAVEIASEGYKTDTVNPVRVIDNWLQLMSLRLRRAQLQASLGLTLARLERVVGEQLTPMPEDPGETGSGASSGQNAPTLRRDEELPLPQRLKTASGSSGFLITG
jgi:hypothetical protein